MMTQGSHSRNEIVTQATSWQGALDAVDGHREVLERWLEINGRQEMIFTGCGSTHYLALFAAPYFQAVTGWSCRAAPSSELVWQTDTILAQGYSPGIIALSRSGETSETVLAVEKLMERGSRALAISCYDSTPLSAAAQRTIAIPEGREQSFAQTRSFAGMLVAVQALASVAARDVALWNELCRLPEAAEGLIARADPVARSFGEDESIRRITFLGSGPLYGLASEATVKMKEMSLTQAEAYHFMEFRHGPMSMVDNEHLVVALLSEEMRPYEVSVLRDLKAVGARILVIGNDPAGLGSLADAVFDLETTLSERAQPVLYLPMLQLMAYHRSLAKGLNPDRPRNVVMAIVLSGADMVDDDSSGL
jgi:glutamine---fructose-6-phosphate transaminase (isomerizing)